MVSTYYWLNWASKLILNETKSTKVWPLWTSSVGQTILILSLCIFRLLLILFSVYFILLPSPCNIYLYSIAHVISIRSTGNTFFWFKYSRLCAFNTIILHDKWVFNLKTSIVISIWWSENREFSFKTSQKIKIMELKLLILQELFNMASTCCDTWIQYPPKWLI